MELSIASSDSTTRDTLHALLEWNVFRRTSRPSDFDPDAQGPQYQWLTIEIVQRVIDRLQMALDSEEDGIKYDHKKCLGLLRFLSKRFQTLPSSLVVQEIQRVGQNPVAGGGFADIWRGTLNGKSVCLKVLRLTLEQDETARAGIRKQFCHEALVWRQLKHPNILPLLGVNTELFSPSFCLVSPLMENRDIITFLKQNPNHNLLSVLREVAAGLHYLHSRDPPIIHGDVRGGNILVTDDLRCCLADFGLTLVTTTSQTWTTTTSSSATRGSIRWLAPEYISLKGSVPNHTSRDVYAFGCTVFEILTRKPPFHDHRNEASVLLNLISGRRPERPQNNGYPDLFWDLTTHCWAQNAQVRPSAKEICETLENNTVFPQNDETGGHNVRTLELDLKRSKRGHECSDLDGDDDQAVGLRDSKRLKADRSNPPDKQDAYSLTSAPTPSPNVLPGSDLSNGTVSQALGNPASNEPSFNSFKFSIAPKSPAVDAHGVHGPVSSRAAIPINIPGNFPDEISLSSLPPGLEYKKEGEDWFIMYNPKAEKESSSTHSASSPLPVSTPDLADPSTQSKRGRSLALACYFCHTRKITCVPQDPYSADRTCNQCHQRSLKCEYPTESRRGMHKKNLSITIPVLSLKAWKAIEYPRTH